MACQLSHYCNTGTTAYSCQFIAATLLPLLRLRSLRLVLPSWKWERPVLSVLVFLLLLSAFIRCQWVGCIAKPFTNPLYWQCQRVLSATAAVPYFWRKACLLDCWFATVQTYASCRPFRSMDREFPFAITSTATSSNGGDAARGATTKGDNNNRPANTNKLILKKCHCFSLARPLPALPGSTPLYCSSQFYRVSPPSMITTVIVSCWRYQRPAADEITTSAAEPATFAILFIRCDSV